MNSQRLKQLRLARGLSLEGLAAAMGGIVTKQALSKYEQGKDEPSPKVLEKLAAALGIKAARLWGDIPIEVQFIAYPKRARLGKRSQQQIESRVQQMLEDRVRLQALTRFNAEADVPVQNYALHSVGDAERFGEDLRNLWGMGHDPIASVTGVLEDHHIHVIEMDADIHLDGLSAFVRQGGHVAAAAVVIRKGVSGERQRFSLSHELGHLVQRTADEALAEPAASRFAGAFLAPAATIRREVGARRTYLQLEELLLLKQRFGMSLQALLYRLRDLNVITESHYKQWCVDISQKGWRTQEPHPLPPEQPMWLRQQVLRVFAEGAISRDEATDLLGSEVELAPPLGLIEKHAFLKLSIEERRHLLAEQADKAAAYYLTDHEWQGGDIVDYGNNTPAR